MSHFFGLDSGRWRTRFAAFARAWLPTWRFYDSPDYWIEIRCGREQPWRKLVRPQPFRLRYFALNPSLVDRMWCESRLRYHLDRANEHGRLETAAFQEMAALIERALDDAIDLQTRHWSIRTRDALDGSIAMELHRSGGGELRP